jgi:hypothetical protein
MSFPGLDQSSEPVAEADQDLAELVVIHAGNPDDGCCGVWIGAPIVVEDASRSPWVWIEPLWLAELDEARADEPGTRESDVPRHDELPEPVITLEPIAITDVEGATTRDSAAIGSSALRHDELSEPVIALESIVVDDADNR